MGAPSRSPRARSSGGRTLMLLGVLLALAAGTIVIYIVSQATGSPTQTVQVVVAAKAIPAGTELLATAPTTGNTTGTMLVADAFVTKNVNSDFAPTDALVFSSQQDLDVKLNDHVVISDIFAGEILRQSDPRLVELGTAPNGSATLFNPGKLPTGDVLWGLKLADSSSPATGVLKAGDVIDLLVTECNLPGSQDPHGCEAQTTLQNLYVYEVVSNAILVAVTPQQALQLKYLQETGKMDYAIRKPGETNTVPTTPVDASAIAKDFGY